MSPVKYDLGFISQKTTFLIVPAVKTSPLTLYTGSLFQQAGDYVENAFSLLFLNMMQAHGTTV
jgi:hypothetical protein